ncbi:hypothetical protein [Nonomuraea sp. GTA35]|uniref:hypothetical protein n=1 Tax=Nonomuraea sp. GTA35 TaxID=1676746 RepID=UPI0035BED5E6
MLVIETGVVPPENDAFVSGWVLRIVERHWMSNATSVLADDRLLDHMLLSLFQAAGVAGGLNWSSGREGDRTVIGELVELTRTGRALRKALLDGCVSRVPEWMRCC